MPNEGVYFPRDNLTPNCIKGVTIKMLSSRSFLSELTVYTPSFPRIHFQLFPSCVSMLLMSKPVMFSTVLMLLIPPRHCFSSKYEWLPQDLPCHYNILLSPPSKFPQYLQKSATIIYLEGLYWLHWGCQFPNLPSPCYSSFSTRKRHQILSSFARTFVGTLKIEKR